MQKEDIRWIDFIPLAVFTWGGRLFITADSVESLATQFYYGAAVALIHIGITLHNKWRINYTALGANLFLLYGTLGYALSEALLLPYLWFKQAALFVWILLIELLTIFFLKGTAVTILSKKARQKTSFIALGMTMFILSISMVLINVTKVEVPYTIMLPFIVLMGAKELVKRHILENTLFK